MSMDEISLFDEISPALPSTDWKWSFKDYPEKNGLTVFSCFACGGGSTMGYKLAGCDVLGCVEIDPKMNEVYVKNHHPRFNYLMDIREFNALPDSELPQELFHLDILDGSPPCTTFSMAGDREEGWGVKKKFREGQAEQTLDDLSFIFIETVKKLKPKVVIMENVEGLLLGDAWAYVQRIYKEFAEAGYVVHHWLLKGEHMGVPQTRHRVFFVAIRASLGIDPSYLDMSFNYEPVPYERIKSGTGEKINPNTNDYKMLTYVERTDKNIADIYGRLGETERRFSAMLCWDETVLPTIVAKLFHYRPIEKERISSTDVIYAQTFPEDYDFLSDSSRQIEYICGMSVPPIMIKRLVTRLIEQGVFDYKLKRRNTDDRNDE